jgi:inner membrane protein
MDNLTHSLIGAALGQAGLKRKTGLALPALIIAANIPDIDAGCVVFGVESLAMRRGITHGPLAMVLLPLLLAGALWWFDSWQTRRGTRPEGRLPVQFGWLLALSVIGCLSHPLFDWFNNYGVRLLEPFSSQWFYGDTLFIIDPWIIAMLGAGVWFSLWRERASVANWMRPAWLGLVGLAGYVALNLGISSLAAMQAASDAPYAEINVANAPPLAFWRREVLWRTSDGRFGKLDCTALACRRYPLTVRKTNMADPRIALWAKYDPAALAFLFWSRMPIAELHDDRIILRDQRFMDPRTAAQFSVTLLPAEE